MTDTAWVPPPSQEWQDTHPDWNRGTLYGRLRVLTTTDLDTSTPRDYLLKGLISPAEISLWVGPPKCGKSFLLLYIAYMLSLGRSVFGRRVKITTVLYVAAEGEGGITKRIEALRRRYGDSPNFHFIAQPADLLHHNGDLDDLRQAAEGVGAQLIILDTLSRLMAGGDENSPQDMGTFIRNVANLRHETKAHIAIVHHGTKASNGSTPRGHSSLTGADDALVEVMKLDDDKRGATVIHAKDDSDGHRFGFTLEHVELGRDCDGDPITTLITTETDQPPQPEEKAGKLPNNEQIALTCLHKAIKASAILVTTGDDFSQQSAVTEAIWRQWFYREGKPGEEANTKRMAFKRAKDALVAKGRIHARDDYVWINTAHT